MLLGSVNKEEFTGRLTTPLERPPHLRAAPARFERRAAKGRALGDGDVLVTDLTPDSEVVVQGAQSLLGEELRWSIPAEGDD